MLLNTIQEMADRHMVEAVGIRMRQTALESEGTETARQLIRALDSELHYHRRMYQMWDRTAMEMGAIR